MLVSAVVPSLLIGVRPPRANRIFGRRRVQQPYLMGHGTLSLSPLSHLLGLRKGRLRCRFPALRTGIPRAGVR